MKNVFGIRTALTTAALLLIASGAHAASFDCNKAKTSDEKAICKSRTLSELDVKMATLFAVDTHLVAMGTRGAIQDEQTEWLAARHTCGARSSCLKTSYDKRIRELQAHFDDIASRGPF